MHPLTPTQRTLERKLAELGKVEQTVQYHLNNGEEPKQVAEWATERRAGLEAEIAELRLKAGGHAATASNPADSRVTLTAAAPTPVTTAIPATVRAAYDKAMKAALSPGGAPAVRQPKAQEAENEEQPAEEPSADDLMEGARQRSLRRKQRQLDGR